MQGFFEVVSNVGTYLMPIPHYRHIVSYIAILLDAIACRELQCFSFLLFSFLLWRIFCRGQFSCSATASLQCPVCSVLWRVVCCWTVCCWRVSLWRVSWREFAVESFLVESFLWRACCGEFACGEFAMVGLLWRVSLWRVSCGEFALHSLLVCLLVCLLVYHQSSHLIFPLSVKRALVESRWPLD